MKKINVIDFNTILNNWGTVVIGALFSFFFINRYQRNKDKAKLKEKILFSVANYWAYKLKILANYHRIKEYTSRRDSLIELTFNVNKEFARLKGYFIIYVKDTNTLKELEELLSNTNNLTTGLANEDFDLHNNSEELDYHTQRYDDDFNKINQIFVSIHELLKKSNLGF